MSETLLSHPHAAARVVCVGSPLCDARGAVILLHGRGATAEDIISLADEIAVPDITYLAPQAVGYSWYPNSFLVPSEQNEPFLSSALAVVDRLIAECADAGVPSRRIVLGGFSQGACLALEYGARHPHMIGGILGYSGGLIGEKIGEEAYAGSMHGTPVFLGCDEHDPHIPAVRVHKTAEVFQSFGAEVTMRLYQRLGHSINEDELEFGRSLVFSLSLSRDG